MSAHPHPNTPAAESGSVPARGATARKASVRSIAGIAIVIALAAGMAAAGSHHGTSVAGIPVFAAVVGWIFLVQVVAFIPAWLRQTETFYDLVGSLTYITSIVAAVLLGGHTDAASLLIAGAVTIWAVRLGSFLFARVRRSGSDDRFDEIKTSAPRFLTVWMMQGLWVTMTLAAALAAVTARQGAPLGVLTVAGLVIWLIGFGIETVADAQKKAFRANPANQGDFIRSGLWAWSRHPNYFGEITLWLGIAIAALPALRGWQYATLVSPLFVAVLLTRISGIPLLERKAQQRWGDDAAYREYRAATSVLVPLPPRTRGGQQRVR